ncbi:FAD linked oxidases, C-terminal domain [Streptomyces sp. KS_16]|nr:FAD linked oxidases, C-terminal domain [Streptomyces sp. KS_16]SED97422.1 FAD linked oxidases, C-terminal domain [Streptomyces sp. 2133.1]SNC73301.1 FAD linked oxidases, C-terminal domain [Streptomyces sp. 2114.4]
MARIRAKYRIKNTNGCRLDAFLDGATPVEILRGLMAGSEGTLGFIAETVFDTLPLDRHTFSALLFFPTLSAAAAAVPRFNEAGARAVGLMDGNTLRASVRVAGVPADWAALPQETTALLVEFRASDEAAQEAYERAAAQVLTEPAEVARYAAFMDAFCRLTVRRFDGSLKAEHATGRNIAPFLELEWGPRATELLWRIKKIVDPHGILAPRVLLDRDPRAHLRGLKTIPETEAPAYACIECGFCEPACPSGDLTTTPRQRIVLRREMARQPSGSPVTTALLESYGYDAVDTCAGDSLCRPACPVGIDTGALMRDLRHRRHSPREEWAAAQSARHFQAVERAARLAVAAADRIGHRLTASLTRAARRAVRPDPVPEWLPRMPGAAARTLPTTRRSGAAAVYYPACVNRMCEIGMDRATEGRGYGSALLALERATRPARQLPSGVRLSG